MDEQKADLKSYGRNQSLDDEIKKHNKTSSRLKLSMATKTKPMMELYPKNRKNGKKTMSKCRMSPNEKANFCSNIILSL